MIVLEFDDMERRRIVRLHVSGSLGQVEQRWPYNLTLDIFAQYAFDFFKTTMKVA